MLWLALTAAAGVALVVGIVRGRWQSLVMLVCLGFVLGATLSVCAGLRVDAYSGGLRDCGARTWTGRVIADPREGSYGQRIQLKLVGGPCAGAVATVAWTGDTSPEIGEMVEFRAVLSPAVDDAEYGRQNVRAGVVASGDPWQASVTGWASGITGALMRWRASAVAACADDVGPGAALLRGIALGDRRALRGSDVEQDFRILGLSHVLAVSGMHLGLVCALVVGACRLLRCPRRVALLVVVVAGAGFVTVTGMPVSAMRALAMVAAASLAEVLGVRRNGIASLAVAVLCLLVVGPWGVFSIGLQLSVLAVGGLLLFGRLAGAWSDACAAGVLGKPVGVMSLTCVAQAVTAPVTVGAFGMFSILAPVANSIVLPVLPLALCSGLFGLIVQGIGLDFLGEPLVTASEWLLGLLGSVTGFIASLPGAAVMVSDSGAVLSLGTLAVGVVMWARWPLPRTRRQARGYACVVVAALVVGAAGLPTTGQARLVALDVGQGDAILVSEGGRTMLVDTGADGGVLRAALAREGVRRIDVIVLTHAHDDHTGGLAGLVGVVQVGWVGVPSCIDPVASEALQCVVDRLTPRGAVPLRPLSAGQRFCLGETVIEVVWPREDAPEPDNTNDTSVVLAVRRGTFDAVLTGDAEGLVQEELAQLDALPDIEVLKVPHHGSTNGLSKLGIDGWRPEVAVISVGVGNRFDHPHAETLGLLEEAGAVVYRTDLCGDVIVEIGVDGYRVWTRRVCENVRGPPLRRTGDRTQGASVAVKGLAELKPVYLIWGKEELLLAEAVKRLRDRIAEVADLDFNFDTFDGENAEAGAIVSAANTLPFASERRLIIVRNVDKMNSAGQNVIAEYAQNPASTACLVLVAGSVSRNSRLFKAVDALGGAAEYRAPRRNEYPSWVISHFAGKGREISLDGAELLVRAVGRDLRRLDVEAEKIVAFAGEKKRISKEDVEEVVSETAPTSVFEFLDAVGARECAAAMGLLADLVDGGESVAGIHAMAVRHVRILLSVRALLDRDASGREIASEIRAADWQVKNYVKQAKRFEESELVDALLAAADTEGRIKSGAVDPRLGLERWVVGVCGASTLDR